MLLYEGTSLKKKLETRTFKNFLGISFSKATGYARDLLLALKLGSDSVMDAWALSFQILTSLKTALVETPLESISIPVMSKIANDKEKHQSASGSLLAKIVFMLIPTLLILSLFSKNIATFLTAYKPSDIELEMFSSLIKGLLGYVSGAVISIWASCVLRSQGRMLAASLTPIILNLSIIACVLFLKKDPIETLTWGAGWGAWIGVIFQFYAFSLGKRWPKINWNNKYQQQFDKKYLEGVGVGIFPSLTLIATRYYATLLGSGSISWLYYSTRLIQVPNSLIGVCIAQASLPELSIISKSNFSRELEKALRIGFILAIPMTIYFFFESRFFTELLFQYGKFTNNDTAQVAAIFKILAISLPLVISESILTKACYAKNIHKKLIGIKLKQFLSCVAFLIFFFYGNFENKLSAVPISSVISVSIGVLLLRKEFEMKNKNIFSISKKTKKYLIGIFFLFMLFKQLEHNPWLNTLNALHWIKAAISACSILYVWKNEVIK